MSDWALSVIRICTSCPGYSGPESELGDALSQLVFVQVDVAAPRFVVPALLGQRSKKIQLFTIEIATSLDQAKSLARTSLAFDTRRLTPVPRRDVVGDR